MSLEGLRVFNAALAVSAEPGMFTFEVDYNVYEGFKGPHDFDKVLIRMPVACLGEVVVVGKVFASYPFIDEGGRTIGVIVKVALADPCDLK